MAGTALSQFAKWARIAAPAAVAVAGLIAPDVAHSGRVKPAKKAAAIKVSPKPVAVKRPAPEPVKTIPPEEACYGEAVLDPDGHLIPELSKRPHDPMLMASTSKLATDLVLADLVKSGAIKPEEPLRFVPWVQGDVCSIDKIPANAPAIDGTVNEAMMYFNVLSSNTAGQALGQLIEHRSGKKFAGLANKTMLGLGLQKTLIVEPTGISNAATCNGFNRKMGPWKVAEMLASKVTDKMIKSAHAAGGSDNPVLKQNMSTPFELGRLMIAAANNAFLAPYLKAQEMEVHGKTRQKTNEYLAKNDFVLGKSGYTFSAGGALTFKNKSTRLTVAMMQCQSTGTGAETSRNLRADQLDRMATQWHIKMHAPKPVAVIDPLPELRVEPIKAIETPMIPDIKLIELSRPIIEPTAPGAATLATSGPAL